MHGGEHLMRSRALFRCQVFEAALEERRFDRSRADAVDANSILGVVHRKRLGQEDHAGLRRAVGGHLARALETGDRRGAQDHAAPLHQLGQRVLAAEENALQIDVDRAIPFLLGEQMRTPGEADPGIVVEDVETAEVTGGLGDHPLGIGGPRYVRANRDRLAAAFDYFSRDRMRALLGTIDDGDICALGREQQRRGASYSRSAAGDQRGFSFELAHFPFHSVFIRRDRNMVRSRGRALLASSLRLVRASSSGEGARLSYYANHSTFDIVAIDRQSPISTSREDATMARNKRQIPLAHPGEILNEEFLKPLGMTINALALALRVPSNRIYAIVAGERGVSADTALRLGRYFATGPEFWLNLQVHYDLESLKGEYGAEIERQVQRRRA